MKNNFRFLSTLFLMVFTGLFAYNTHAAPSVTASAIPVSPEKSIVVSAQDPKFSVSLPSNPTTGYSWFLQSYDSSIVTVVNHHFVAPTQKLIGAGGSETWNFTVKSSAFAAPQITTIRLIYSRPWNINPSDKTVEFTVVVR